MVGRGAIGKPWIFKLMKDYIIDGLEEQKLYSNLIYEVVIEHFNQMIQLFMGEIWAVNPYFQEKAFLHYITSKRGIRIGRLSWNLGTNLVKVGH